MTRTRLALRNPDLAATFTAASPAARTAAGVAACRMAVSAFLSDDALFLDALEQLDRDAPSEQLLTTLDRRVQAWDERYLVLWDQDTTESRDAAGPFFEKARAGMAVQFALQRQPEEAIYETLVVFEDRPAFIATVRAALAGGIPDA